MTKPGEPDSSQATQSADRPSEVPEGRNARRLAYVGAWLSGLALAALVGWIASLVIDANRPTEATSTKVTINGRSISGADAKEALRDAGTRILKGLTDRGEESSSEGQERGGDTAEHRRAESLSIEAEFATRSAERSGRWSLVLAGVLALIGSVLGGVARWQGARGAATWIALWPIGLVVGLGTALPSCAG